MQFVLPTAAFPQKKAAASSLEGPTVKKGKTKHQMDQEELAEITLATAHLALEVKQECRAHEAFLTQTMLADEAHASVAAALEEGQQINKDRTERKGENTGSPFVRQCLKFVQALALSKEVQELPAENEFKKTLEEWWTMVQNLEKDMMGGEIIVFQCLKPKVKTDIDGMGAYARIRIGLGPKSQDFQVQLMEFASKKLGWKVKAGIAPPTTGERNLRRLVNRRR